VDSEHNSTNVCVGENWTTAQINAVMSGPDWASSVIVVSWDDYGGFYDHVAPQNIDALGEGFRVPLLVISPFTTPHITHNQYEFASVLKLAEEAFHLPSLGQSDVSAGDLMTDLDLTQQNPPLLLQQRTCPTASVPPAPANIDD
jgi:phospholipase C